MLNLSFRSLNYNSYEYKGIKGAYKLSFCVFFWLFKEYVK